jgi:cytochrome c
MQKTSISFLIMLVLGLFLVTAGCTQNQPDVATSTPGSTEIQQETSTSNETLVAFVDSAAAYAKTHGREKALAEFNNPNGSFVRGELYIYAYDFNGTTLAHPFNPEKIGVNRLAEPDAQGGYFIKDLRDAAIKGSGFVRFYYINPVHNRSIEPKLGYVEKVDDDWWLGSGIYTDPTTPVTGAATPSTPDIVGVWTGTSSGHVETVGFCEGAAPRYTFTAQNGPAFVGYEEYTRGDGVRHSENVSGVIACDGGISIVEHDGGYALGEFVEPGEIELRHFQDGDTATVFIFHLKREMN